MSDRQGIAPNWTVLHVPETGSTNDDLIVAVENGSAWDRTVLRTDHQMDGRGRLDRRWEAPPGANLLVSILFSRPPPSASVLPQAVGRAALDAVESLADSKLDARLGLKWPNDLLLDDRKLSGVLAQRSNSTGAIVVGIGLNVGWAPPGAASLVDDLGLHVAPAVVLDVLLDHLGRSLAAGDVATRYRNRLATLDTHVRAELPDGRSLVGTAVDLDDDGRLMVEVDDGSQVGGGVVTLDVGDIVHLRPVC